MDRIDTHILRHLERGLAQTGRARPRHCRVSPRRINEIVTGSVEYLLRVEVSDLSAYKHFHSDLRLSRYQVSSISDGFWLGSSKDPRS